MIRIQKLKLECKKTEETHKDKNQLNTARDETTTPTTIKK